MAQQNGSAVPAVYVQTNDATSNELLVFERHGDGRLAPGGRFATGGRGTGQPHLPSQGSIVLSEDGSRVLVVMPAATRSLFAVEGGGLRLTDRVASGGARPTTSRRG